MIYNIFSQYFKRYIFIATIILFLGIIFFSRQDLISVDSNNQNIVIENNKKINQLIINTQSQENKEISPLSGLPCANYKARPFAVMMAGDKEARPLSGISMADIVVEAPVITGDITRYMALFLCEMPAEIGSLRSARDDFIPLAKGWDAIFVHWGGSHFALDTLKKKVIDNIDALTNPFQTFYRKPSIPAPHNGFTSYDKLKNAAQSFNFKMESTLTPYPFLTSFDLNKKHSGFASLVITYAGKFKVKYIYNEENGNYQRFKNDSPEIDKLTNKQVVADNILVLETSSKQIEGQYNDLKVIGEGNLKAYILGKEILGKWKKDNYNAKLTFFDNQNQEIALKPGKTWIHFIDPRYEEAIYYQK